MTLFPTLVWSQEYLTLKPGQWAYDVEVVIFGRQLAQPDSLTINNRLSQLDVPTQSLITQSNELPLIKELPVVNKTDESEQWQVPLEGEKPKQQALVWTALAVNGEHPVINKLRSNPTIKPLHYQKWRQPATDFLSPEYVIVSSIEKPEYVVHEDLETTSPQEENQVYNDYSFDGVVAYSKQKFDHVTVKMNYFRHDPIDQLISYTIDQKQRIKLGIWQYFDHQQFGVMVKVTAISIQSAENGE